MARTKPKYTLKGSPTEGLFGATLGFFIGFVAVSRYPLLIPA